MIKSEKFAKINFSSFDSVYSWQQTVCINAGKSEYTYPKDGARYRKYLGGVEG